MERLSPGFSASRGIHTARLDVSDIHRVRRDGYKIEQCFAGLACLLQVIRVSVASGFSLRADV